MRAPSLTLLFALLTGCARSRPPAPAVGPEDATLGAVDVCSAYDNPDFQRRLDRRTRTVERDGNAAELLVDGATAFQRRLDNSFDADVILVKTFIWTDDEVGRRFAALLAARARAGALVVVQYDYVGSMAGTAEAVATIFPPGAEGPADKPVFRDLIAAGGLVIPANAPGSRRQLRRSLEKAGDAQGADADLADMARFRLLGGFRHFDHEKYWITGRWNEEGDLVYEAILGGMNVASEYAYGGTGQVDAGSGRGGWRDTDVALRGPVVEDVVERYFAVARLHEPELEQRISPATWQRPQPAAGQARARFARNQPALKNRRRIERLYRNLVQATPGGSTIRLESAYFTPSPRLIRPLEAALRRDARLAVITNSRESTDIRIVARASRGAYERLLKAEPTAALYEWRAAPGHATLHSKVASFGTCGPVVIGSANLDGLSSEHNSENVVLVYDPALRQAFDAMFDADLAAADRITAEDARRSTWLGRAWRRLILRFGWRWLGG